MINKNAISKIKTKNCNKKWQEFKSIRKLILQLSEIYAIDIIILNSL